MKTILRILLLVGCVAMQRGPENLLLNGNLEEDVKGWSYVSEGDAAGKMERVADLPLDGRTPNSLKLVADRLGQRCGIANQGAGSGISVTRGQWFEATFFARAEGPRGIGLVFSLESPDGKTVCARTTLPEIGRGGEIGRPVEGNDRWRQYSVTLRAYASQPNCRLVISPIEPATLYFDDVSLTSRSAPTDEARRETP